jgi:AraC-like DNA-binding protein
VDPLPDWHVTGSRTVDVVAGRDVPLPRPAAWLLVRTGEAVIAAGRGDVVVGPGDAAYVDDAWSARLTARTDGRILLAAVRAGAGGPPLPRPLVVPRFADDNEGVIALLELCPVAAGWSDADVGRSYGALLAASTRRGSAAGEPPLDDDLSRVEAAVLSDPDRPWTLGSLARLVHVSRSTFGERFRAATGTSPMQFVREARMRRARELLADPERSVTQVAEAVGYGSVAAFSRAFTSAHGRTPRAWRATSAPYPRPQPRGGRSAAKPAAPASARTAPSVSTGVSPVASRS